MKIGLILMVLDLILISVYPFLYLYSLVRKGLFRSGMHRRETEWGFPCQKSEERV